MKVTSPILCSYTAGGGGGGASLFLKYDRSDTLPLASGAFSFTWSCTRSHRQALTVLRGYCSRVSGLCLKLIHSMSTCYGTGAIGYSFNKGGDVIEYFKLDQPPLWAPSVAFSTSTLRLS